MRVRNDRPRVEQASQIVYGKVFRRDDEGESMSEIRKCDRCGVQKEIPSGEDYSFPPDWEHVDDRDLCAACYKEFDEFMAAKKTPQ